LAVIVEHLPATTELSCPVDELGLPVGDILEAVGIERVILGFEDVG